MEPENQIEFLTGLISQYSPTRQETPAVDYLAEWMSEQGFQVSIDAQGSVIGSLGQGPDEILLLGHIDTVPGSIPVRQEGDLLYGRGSVDAKGPLACFSLAAFLCGVCPGWKVTVVGAVGEEGDSRGAKLIRDRYKPTYCIIGEPSGWDHITLAYKGSAWFHYSIQRPMSHTAARTESACDLAFAFWNSVRSQFDAFNQDRKRAFDQVTASLRKFDSSTDGLIDQAHLEYNLRLPPDVSIAQMNAWMDLSQGEGTVILLDGIDCYRGEKNNPLVRSLLAAIRTEQGKPGFLVKTGTSDMNIVGPAWQIPILAYGPGDSNLDHTPNEHISINEFLKSVRILTHALNILQA